MRLCFGVCGYKCGLMEFNILKINMKLTVGMNDHRHQENRLKDNGSIES